jgi:uncharacterized protein (TIGR02611 family)
MRSPAILATVKGLKRFFIALIGMTTLILGILMIVLPGPAIVFIPLGLAILATEFVWARVWLNKIKDKKEEILKKLKGR